MEFFATTTIPASAADLQRRLTISELPRWCASIEKVLSDAKSSGEIYCVWGTFHTHREDLRHGVRFSLLSTFSIEAHQRGSSLIVRRRCRSAAEAGIIVVAKNSKRAF